MKQWQKVSLGGALAAALCAAAGGQAVAGPLVSSWTYEINNAFELFEPVSGVVGLDPNAELGFPTRLEWPLSGSGRSALEVDGVLTGSDLQTNGATVSGGTLTHDNAPVATRFQDQFLSSGRLRVRVDLSAPETGSDETVSVETFFDFAFKETENTGSCGFESASSCDDIFVLVDDGGLSKQFTFQGQTYTLIFGSEQLSTLDPAACQQLGIGAGCVGFLTPENASTDFRTFIRIVGPSVVPVPEPEILLLVGTGLVILGMARRRRRAT